MSADKSDTQVSQIKSAIKKVVEVGPEFLSNKISAEKMAHTMIKTVDEYAYSAEKVGNIRPESEEAEELMQILMEIKGCGSGFLADRCDADCVARTITYLVDEFLNE